MRKSWSVEMEAYSCGSLRWSLRGKLWCIIPDDHCHLLSWLEKTSPPGQTWARPALNREHKSVTMSVPRCMVSTWAYCKNDWRVQPVMFFDWPKHHGNNPDWILPFPCDESSQRLLFVSFFSLVLIVFQPPCNRQIHHSVISSTSSGYRAAIKSDRTLLAQRRLILEPPPVCGYILHTTPVPSPQNLQPAISRDNRKLSMYRYHPSTSHQPQKFQIFPLSRKPRSNHERLAYGWSVSNSDRKIHVEYRSQVVNHTHVCYDDDHQKHEQSSPAKLDSSRNKARLSI